jgi:hypothetical protein
MSPDDIFPYVTGAGGALFVLLLGMFLFITDIIMSTKTSRREVAAKEEVIAAKDAVILDKDKQIDYYQRALELERNRNEVSDLAARTATSVLQALHKEAEVQ